MAGLTAACSSLSSSSFLGAAVRPAAVGPRRCQAAFQPIRAAQTLQGKVLSTKMDKTAVVEVASLQVHPVYQKRVRSTSKYIAHNLLDVQPGDIVSLAPSRPLSKNKRFVVESVVKKAQ